MIKHAFKRGAGKGVSVGMKIASFARKELQKEAKKAMHSKKVRILAVQAAGIMKSEAVKFERAMKAEIAREMKKKCRKR